MALFDGLQKAYWLETFYEFPVSHAVVTVGLRDHVHEYPHSPGGAPEKLGRKLIEVKLTCPFMETFKAYPNLFSKLLPTLRIFAQAQRTGTLSIPTLGTIQAYPISWEEDTDSKVRSGVMVSMTFREDSPEEFTIQELIKVGSSSVSSDLSNFSAQLAAEDITGIDIFDSIISAGQALLAYIALPDDLSDQIAQKADALTSLCAQADATVTVLNDPSHFRVTDALHQLWSSTAKLSADVMRNSLPVVPFIVPGGLTMSAADISRARFGDNSHAIEIVRMNPNIDPFKIRGGTSVRAYSKAA